MRERYEKDELGWVRVSGWVDGKANDTSLGNFNFAEITVEANKNKEISAKRSLSLCVSLSLSLSLFTLSRSFILLLHQILFSSCLVERDTSSDIIRLCRRFMYRTASMFGFLLLVFLSFSSFFNLFLKTISFLIDYNIYILLKKKFY